MSTNLDLMVSRPQPLAPYHPEAPASFGDNRALQLWLSIFDLKSRATARHYRTQSGKFRLFLRLLHPDWDEDSHLQRAGEQDIAMYEMALLLKPMPNGEIPKLELSAQELARMGLDSQPFSTALKKSSVNQALSVLNALYEFLRTPNGMMTQPYVTVNPVKRVRKSVTRTVRQSDRHISLEGIQAMRDYLLTAIDLATKARDAKAIIRYERRLWIFTLLFGLWGRREEISNLSMGDFQQQYDQSWKVSVQRKGDKHEELPAASWVIEGLRRYRASLGLPKSWVSSDPTPAVQGLRLVKGSTNTEHISPQTLYLEIKALAGETANEIACGALLPSFSPERRAMLSERLERCSPHWFRHTGPTIAINSGNMSVENASKMLGHSSLATTTQMYYHADNQKILAGLDSLGSQLKGETSASIGS